MAKVNTALRIFREKGWKGIFNIFGNKYKFFLYKTGELFALLKPAQHADVRAKDAVDFWAESSKSAYIRDQSHWLGEGRWQDSKAWENIGRTHFEMWKQLKKICGMTGKTKRMMEWGPGGGGNIVRFVNDFETIYGIDISEANLAECRKQAAARGFNNFFPVFIDAMTPESCLKSITEPCDFFLSTAVFQHFPGKEYGASVLKIAHTLLHPGGLALVQIRYDDLNPIYAPKKRDYKKNAITFTSYNISEFWRLATNTGFTPHFVKLMPDINYAYYYLSKPNR